MLHVITGLKAGGAEACMARLIEHDPGRRHAVISLGGLDHHGPRLRAAGIETIPLLLGGGGPIRARHLGRLDRMATLAHHVRRLRPDVVQTWMYHADVLGGLVARACRVPAIVWNVRVDATPGGVDGADRSGAVRRIAALSRRVPHAIVCCSASARDSHVALGYPASACTVIENGYALPEPLARDAPEVVAARDELGVTDGDLVVGLVGRHDPVKNHDGLLDAVAGLPPVLRGRVHVWLAGARVSPDNAELARSVARRGLQGRVRLLGVRDDLRRLYPAMDLLVSASLEEGFPNVVAEATIAGTPVVATAVGETASVLGGVGRLVVAGDATALGGALEAALREASDPLRAPPWREACAGRGRRLRSVETMVADYARLWDGLADRLSRPADAGRSRSG